MLPCFKQQKVYAGKARKNIFYEGNLRLPFGKYCLIYKADLFSNLSTTTLQTKLTLTEDLKVDFNVEGRLPPYTHGQLVDLINDLLARLTCNLDTALKGHIALLKILPSLSATTYKLKEYHLSE